VCRHPIFSFPFPSLATLPEDLFDVGTASQTPDSHTDLFSTHCYAPHPHRGATESPCLWPRTTASVTPSSVARLLRACHTLDGRRLLSLHGRAASRGTTVPESRWHGVSGRGASKAWLPKPLAKRRPATPQQKLVRHSAYLQAQVSAPSGRGRNRRHGSFPVRPPTFSVWLKILDPLISAIVPRAFCVSCLRHCQATAVKGERDHDTTEP